MAILVAGLPTASIAAQSQQAISVQVSALIAPVSDDAYDLKTGKGAEAQLRYTPGAFSYGIGVQWTGHDAAASVGPREDFSLIGAFFEPRYVIDVGYIFAPYVSSRLAVLRQNLHVPNQAGADELSGQSTSVQVNGGGGILLRVSSTVNLDVGVTYGYIRFGNATMTDKSTGASTEGEKSSSGMNAVYRVGLAIGVR